MLILPEREDVGLTYPTETSADNATDGDTSMVRMNLEFETVANYHLRKRKFNVIFHDVTMEETIMAISEMLGFTKVYVHKPDNTNSYRNMIIPPLHDISSVFGFLQTSSLYGGVYDAGLRHFIIGDTLVVYPALTQIESDIVVNFLYTGPNSLLGVKKQMSIDSKKINIIINSAIKQAERGQRVMENIGNWFIQLCPESIVDDNYTVEEDSVSINEDNLASITISDTATGVINDTFTQSFEMINNNRLLTEQLYQNRMVDIAFKWTQAVPYLIYPLYKSFIITDNGSEMYTKSCILNRLTYNLIKQNTTDNQGFLCECDVSISCITE